MNKKKKLSIPLYTPCLKGNEKKYVNDCLDSTWISSKGKYVTKFEDKFSEFTDSNYSIAVSNGTVALHLALLALGIRPGDEVLVPSFNYIASVNCISYVGATPVFVDSALNDWQIDVADLESKITSKTKAIICVHLYGHPCNMIQISKIARKNNLAIIEDCAEALGSRIGNKHVGNWGDVSTYSFYGNKTITTGEGGMVTTNSSELCDDIVSLKGQGLIKGEYYKHDRIGYNYRMTNICAAIGLAQLENINEILRRKRAIALRYKELLEGSDFIFHDENEGYIHSFWMVSILSKIGERDRIMQYLNENGIETRPAFYPIHKMKMYNLSSLLLENASYLSSNAFNLPSYPDLTDNDIDQIVDVLLSYKKS